MDIRDVCVIWKSKNDKWVAGNISNVDDGIEIIWNSGKIETFREDTDDLLVYDVSPSGTIHEHITCDGCKTKKIVGSRWKCNDCFDFDLCNICYHSNQHSLDHAFKRIDIPGAKEVIIGKRRNVETGEIYGFFAGAKVTRGKDWEWGNQDGGVGNRGTVTELYDWRNSLDLNMKRNGVSVRWDKGKQECNYRICFKGKVDLICLDPAFGGTFYPSHLPTTKMLLSLSKKKTTKHFNVGDLVVACKTLDSIVEAQERHGGLTEDMARSIGVVGKVIGTLSDSVIVLIDDTDKRKELLFFLMSLEGESSRRWRFNPSILQKVVDLKPGDKVKVINDSDTFKVMQKNISNYHPSQDVLIGEEVTILENDNQKLMVLYEHNNVYLSCGAVRKRDKEDEELLGLLLEGFFSSLNEKAKEKKVKEEKDQYSVPDGGARKRVQTKEYGLRELVEMHDVEGVRKLLTDRAHMINIQQNGSTCLHVAIFNNDVEIIDIFLEKNADLSIPDDNGDTLLHIAAAKNLLDTGHKLVEKKCPMNVVNKSGLTPISVAVLKKHVEFVRMLVDRKCRTNIRDPNGNIPLHTAVYRGDNDLVDILLKEEDIDTPNHIGLCAIHLALSKKDKVIAKMIVDIYPQVLNSVIADGATPLHVTVLNGNDEMVEFILTLMTKYERKVTPALDIERKTKTDRTALHIACLEGFLSIVKILLQHGARIDAETQNGMTAVLMCVMKHQLLRFLPQQLQQVQEVTPDLRTVRSHFENPCVSGIVMACFLLENGANINHHNHEGKTVLDLCKDSTLTKLLCEFSKKQVAVTEGAYAATSSEPVSPNNKSKSPATEPPTTKSTPTPNPKPRTTKPKIVKQESELDYDPCQLCESRTPVEGRFKPCGHALFCYEHADNFKACPRCKVAVIGLSRLSIERLPNCIICRNTQVNITFQPCGHQLVCYACSHRFRVCLTCDEAIQTKVPIGEIVRPVPKPRPKPAPRPTPAQPTSPTTSPAVEEEPNEEMMCNICFEHRRNMAFQCGHTLCKGCGDALTVCHMCREVVTHRTIIFF